jgi:hypothetical protein
VFPRERGIRTVFAAVAGLVALGAGSASAATVVDKNPDGSTLRIEASSTDRNRVDVFTDDVRGGPALEFVVREMGWRVGGAPIQIVPDHPSCDLAPAGDRVWCGSADVTRIAAGLYAGRDTFGAEIDDLSSLGILAVKAHGGAARDVLTSYAVSTAPSSAPVFNYAGASGDDDLLGSIGSDVLRGGTGSDGLLAHQGADRVVAADGEADGPIDCGDGVDRLTYDPGLDSEPIDCE